jgi:hypothetical protein
MDKVQKPNISESYTPSSESYSNYLIIILRGGVHLNLLGTGATYRPIVPAPGYYDDGEISGMIGRENGSTLRKLAPAPLCPPHTPHALRTRAAAVGSQRLTI